jgi:hypothetical protein
MDVIFVAIKLLSHWVAREDAPQQVSPQYR